MEKNEKIKIKNNKIQQKDTQTVDKMKQDKRTHYTHHCVTSYARQHIENECFRNETNWNWKTSDFTSVLNFINKIERDTFVARARRHSNLPRFFPIYLNNNEIEPANNKWHDGEWVLFLFFHNFVCKNG